MAVGIRRICQLAAADRPGDWMIGRTGAAGAALLIMRSVAPTFRDPARSGTRPAGCGFNACLSAGAPQL